MVLPLPFTTYAEIHITLSEAELARTYNNIEVLKTHPG